MVTYSTLSRYFSEVKDLQISALGDKIGGKVKQNIDAGIFTNGCAIRMSYAFNYAGESISSNDGAVSSGADGKWYLYRVADMINFVEKTIGGTPITGTSASDFAGRKGIIIFSNCNFSDATGHVDLFNGSSVEGSDYFGNCRTATLYELN